MIWITPMIGFSLLYYHYHYHYTIMIEITPMIVTSLILCYCWTHVHVGRLICHGSHGQRLRQVPPPPPDGMPGMHGVGGMRGGQGMLGEGEGACGCMGIPWEYQWTRMNKWELIGFTLSYGELSNMIANTNGYGWVWGYKFFRRPQMKRLSEGVSSNHFRMIGIISNCWFASEFIRIHPEYIYIYI